MLDHIFKKQSLYSKEQQEGEKKITFRWLPWTHTIPSVTGKVIKLLFSWKFPLSPPPTP